MSNPNQLRISKEIKHHRHDEVVLTALAVFSESGIETATMEEIAKTAHIGVASLYRHYQTKFDLAMAAGILLWKTQINPDFSELMDEAYASLSGLDQVIRLLEVTKKLIQDRPSALRFLEYFDNFIVSHTIDRSRLGEYEEVVGSSKPIFMMAITLGKEDGSIREDLDSEAFYMTITHTLMSLSQKLILRGTVVNSDDSVGKLEQIDLVINMAKTYIKNPVR